jgi:hypothetical protein
VAAGVQGMPASDAGLSPVASWRRVERLDGGSGSGDSNDEADQDEGACGGAAVLSARGGMGMGGCTSAGGLYEPALANCGDAASVRMAGAT